MQECIYVGKFVLLLLIFILQTIVHVAWNSCLLANEICATLLLSESV